MRLQLLAGNAAIQRMIAARTQGVLRDQAATSSPPAQAPSGRKSTPTAVRPLARRGLAHPSPVAMPEREPPEMQSATDWNVSVTPQPGPAKPKPTAITVPAEPPTPPGWIAEWEIDPHRPPSRDDPFHAAPQILTYEAGARRGNAWRAYSGAVSGLVSTWNTLVPLVVSYHEKSDDPNLKLVGANLPGKGTLHERAEATVVPATSRSGITVGQLFPSNFVGPVQPGSPVGGTDVQTEGLEDKKLRARAKERGRREAPRPCRRG